MSGEVGIRTQEELVAALEHHGAPPEVFGAFEAILDETKGCTVTEEGGCWRPGPDGPVAGTKKTMTCTFKNPDGTTWTQTKTWCGT